MVFKQGNEPIFKDKEGNIHIAIFKNKNVNGSKYVIAVLTVHKFPFKYSQKVMLNIKEIDKVRDLLLRLPKIEVEAKKVKT